MEGKGFSMWSHLDSVRKTMKDATNVVYCLTEADDSLHMLQGLSLPLNLT